MVTPERWIGVGLGFFALLLLLTSRSTSHHGDFALICTFQILRLDRAIGRVVQWDRRDAELGWVHTLLDKI